MPLETNPVVDVLTLCQTGTQTINNNARGPIAHVQSLQNKRIGKLFHRHMGTHTMSIDAFLCIYYIIVNTSYTNIHIYIYVYICIYIYNACLYMLP